MMKKIDTLLRESGLPGPRGNLTLMYTFAHEAAQEEADACLSYNDPELSNSPEEFVVMCGVVANCVIHRDDVDGTLSFLRPFASHASWRIREAVAMGIQEMAEGSPSPVIAALRVWAEKGNWYEQRAVAAGLCEPKLLKQNADAADVLSLLAVITGHFADVKGKLSAEQTTLRKTLGYGWSVAVVHLPEKGKAAFEKIARSDNAHIRWIVKENLKKNRLTVMDREWTEKMQESFL